MAAQPGWGAWGGPRPGAGRPPIGDAPEVRVSVSLPAAMVSELERLGGGNVSAGIRRLVDVWERGAGDRVATPAVVVQEWRGISERGGDASHTDHTAPREQQRSIKPDTPPKNRRNAGKPHRWARPVGELWQDFKREAMERAVEMEGEWGDEDEWERQEAQQAALLRLADGLGGVIAAGISANRARQPTA